MVHKHRRVQAIVFNARYARASRRFQHPPCHAAKRAFEDLVSRLCRVVCGLSNREKTDGTTGAWAGCAMAAFGAQQWLRGAQIFGARLWCANPGANLDLTGEKFRTDAPSSARTQSVISLRGALASAEHVAVTEVCSSHAHWLKLGRCDGHWCQQNAAKRPLPSRKLQQPLPADRFCHPVQLFDTLV